VQGVLPALLIYLILVCAKKKQDPFYISLSKLGVNMFRFRIKIEPNRTKLFVIFKITEPNGAELFVFRTEPELILRKFKIYYSKPNNFLTEFLLLIDFLVFFFSSLINTLRRVQFIIRSMPTNTLYRQPWFKCVHNLKQAYS
jgi:thiosulfate reductase cytochrome b subunit